MAENKKTVNTIDTNVGSRATSISAAEPQPMRSVRRRARRTAPKTPLDQCAIFGIALQYHQSSWDYESEPRPLARNRVELATAIMMENSPEFRFVMENLRSKLRATERHQVQTDNHFHQHPDPGCSLVPSSTGEVRRAIADGQELKDIEEESQRGTTFAWMLEADEAFGRELSDKL